MLVLADWVWRVGRQALGRRRREKRGGRGGALAFLYSDNCICVICCFVFVHFFHLGGGLGEAEVGEAGRPGRRSVLFCSTPSGRGGEAGERWLDRWWRPRPAC